MSDDRKEYFKRFGEKYARGELSPKTKKSFEDYLKILDMPHNPDNNEKGNPELTKKDLKFFKEEILINMLETFDLLHDTEKLEDFTMLLSEEERDRLYDHPLLKEFDLLP